MPTPDELLETGETATGATSGTTTKTTDWEASYKGLQASYNKLQASSSKAVTDLNEKVVDLQAQITTLNSTILTHESALAIKDKEIAVLRKSTDDEKTASSVNLKALTRARVILKDFSDLADYEAQDILPAADSEEDLRVKLTNFRKVLEKNAAVKKQEKLAGSGPSTPPPSRNDGGEAETEDLIWQKLSDFAGKDQAKFQEWQKKWDDLQALKKTAK